MRFTSIVLNDNCFDVSGVFDTNAKYGQKVKFDLDEDNNGSLLSAFFGNKHEALNDFDNSKFPSIILNFEEESLYISNPLFSWNVSFAPFNFIHFQIVTFDYTLSNSTTNIETLRITEYHANFSVRKNFSGFYSQTDDTKVGKVLSFKRGFFLVNLTLSPPDRKVLYNTLKLEIIGDRLLPFDEYDNLFFNILELITFVSGLSPTLLERYIKINNSFLKYSRELVDRHLRVHQGESFKPITLISVSTIFNDEVLDKYIDLQLEYGPIYYSFLANLNSSYYVDLKTTAYIQLLSGFVENKHRNETKTTKNLTTYTALCKAFSNYYTSYLLNSNDKTQTKRGSQMKLLSQAVDHRDYFTHFKIEKRNQIFVGPDCHYVNIKFQTAMRILILEQIGVPIELQMIKDIEIRNIRY